MSQVVGRGATPARRSTRLSQAGSVTQQSVVTTVSAGGTRQRKKEVLSKVKSRKSNAYGASGRIAAAEEIAPTATGFTQAFQNQRGDAVVRDDDEDDEEPDDIDELAAGGPYMSGGRNGRDIFSSSAPPPNASTPAPLDLSYSLTDMVAPSESGVAASVGNTSKSFGMNHEGGMIMHKPLRRATPRIQVDDDDDDRPWSLPAWQKRTGYNPPRQPEEPVRLEVPVDAHKAPAPVAHIKPGPSIQEIVAEEQARLQREGPPKPRHKSRRQANNAEVNNWLGGVQDAERDEDEEREWKWMKFVKWLFVVMVAIIVVPQVFDFSTSTQYPESAASRSPISAAGVRFQHAWYGLADWIHPAGTGFQKQITTELLEKNGFVKKETFDNAIIGLTKNFPHFLIVQRKDGKMEITDDFWHALLNKATSPDGEAVWDAFLEKNEQRLQGIFGKATRYSAKDPHPEVVSNEEFLRLVQDSYQKLSTQVDEKISQTVQGQAVQIKAIAQAEAQKAVIDSIALHTLAQSNLLANYELNMRKPNYFSIGLGAIVDPYRTSTTLSVIRSRWARLFIPSRPRNPPSAALDKWEEPGDCWCAAPNPKMNGEARLTVSIPTPVFPQQVTIEHLPMTMIPNKKITNAPRTVELWVETDQSAEYQYGHQQQVCQDGEVGWTCLGSFEYNIHASNHQQTFDLDGHSPVPVTRAMLRVTSNWGADHTCLYRVRLHGRGVEEDHQYGVHLKDPIQ